MNKKNLTILLSMVLILMGSIWFYLNQSNDVEENIVMKEEEIEEGEVNTNDLPTESLVEENWLGNEDNGLPVLIYIKEIFKTVGNSRSWPTVQILGKVGDNDPELLAEVGKEGEYPNEFKLSPDNKFLLINLESKLQILNLTTKELEDLFIPKRQVSSVSYSPNKKQLFIWDQKYVPRDGDESYYAHLFDISTRKDNVLVLGDSDRAFFGGVWRDDGIVTMREAYGGFAKPYYFDLTTNEIKKTPHTQVAGFISASGKLMAIVKENASNICNEFSGSAPSFYNIIDPVSGIILGVVGRDENNVNIIAFSPDDKEALLKVEKPWINREDCDKDIESEYYIATIRTGELKIIKNYLEILSLWDSNYIGASYKYNYKEKTWSISVNGQSLIVSDKILKIVGQFYK